MRLFVTASLCCTLAAVFAAPAVAQSRATRAAALVSTPGVLIIGHRGASAHAPENTIPAFEAAIKAKANLVELDYYHSKDQVPVVFHDKDLDRTTDAEQVLGAAKIKVVDTSLDDLKRLDAGKWFKPQFAGTKIPTLLEGVSAIQAGSMTLIERKSGDAKTIVKFLDEHKLRQDVVVQAFDWEYLADCHKRAPDLVLGALGSKELTPLKIAQAKRAGAAVIGWKHEDLTKDNIDAVHKAGLRCWAYTVNDTRRGKQLIEMGLDGIITDDPAAMYTLVTQLRR